MIPRRLVRTVPSETTEEVEQWWTQARSLHPGWEHVTWRDPINPELFPLTSPHWDQCSHPAQRAGLIRLEDIYEHGGVYIDSDVECYRTFEPLLGAGLFAGWEDSTTIPDAVFGARPLNPIVRGMMLLALDRLSDGPRASGPGVFTDVLPGADVLLLPPGSFYPYHYKQKERRQADHRREQPWAFCAHHWFGSWT